MVTTLRDSDEGIDRYDPARHSWMGPVFGGHDPGVCAYGIQGNVLSLNGIFGRARKRLERGLSLAAELKHPHTQGHALLQAAVTHQVCGDHDDLERCTQTALELADRYNFPPLRAHALIFSGWNRAIGQGSVAGLELMEAEFPRAWAIAPMFRYYAVLLAEVRAKFGKISEALDGLQWAIKSITEPGVGLVVSELYRLRGLCLFQLDPGNEKEAVDCLETALDIARAQKAALLHLKAALDLFAVAKSAGQPERGLRPLRDFCSNSPVEFDAPQLKAARELLAA
jgi:tetratricopeptide (TPR) repeat protein